MAEQDTLRLGIDVGGTNTDAVIVDADGKVVAKTKIPTTPDVTRGISEAIGVVLDAVDDKTRISRVMLGTTHATNAVIERRGLGRVACIRVGGPATHSIPPLAMWPDDLRSTVSVAETIIDGGAEFDGRDQVPLDEAALLAFLDGLDETPDSYAVTSVFAPVADIHERRVVELIREKMGASVTISASSHIGSLGLLERENATVLNSALTNVAHQIIDGLRNACAEHGLEARQLFAQNDGSLMSVDQVLAQPVLTIGSGPANSLRGASALSGLTDAIVVDVGGTSTDVAVIANGFPRESTVPVEIGGVETNFRMPDLLAIGLGGGSRVREGEGSVRGGPDSVGYRLDREALVFGGHTATFSDAAVRSGRAGFGSVAADGLSRDVATRALALADEMVADAIDRMKLSPEPIPVVLVGGGSVLLSDSISGASKVIRPEDADVANAIGAALAPISAQIDELFEVGVDGREAAVEAAKQKVMDLTVAQGADPEDVHVVAVEEMTLAYMKGDHLRIRAKAAGRLD